MKMQRMVWLLLASALLLSTARAQHSDLELFDDDGRVGVEPRIAEGKFGEGLNPAYRADEPGLESDPDELLTHGETPLPGGALVGFDLVPFNLDGSSRGLFYWDGVGSPDFVSLVSPHELRISDPTESFSLQTDGASGAAGFGFTLTADGTGPTSAGFLHSHLLFDLVDSAGTPAAFPNTGVYAFATTFSVAGLSDSEPVYWVLATGIDEGVHETAVDYLSRSVGVVPEPSSLMLASVMLLWGLGRVYKN